MSVIVKCPDGKIRLFCKGADMEIRRRITQNPEQIPTTNRALIKFARLGLRTLMIAYKELNEEEYEEWNKEYVV
jgi:magnesium-transporting ATPase (P-type)